MSLLPSKPDASPSEDAGPRVIGVDSEDAEAVLSALSSETARNILAEVHDDPAPPSELAERVDTSLQNAQYHLENLEDAGAVEVVDTAYSAKGREMDVYAAADQPLVIFAGDQEDSSILRTAIQRLVGALGVLALASLAVQALFGREISAPAPTGQGGGDAAGGDGAGAADGDGGDGGGDASVTGDDAAGATETPTAEPDTLDAGGTATPDATGTPTAEAMDTPTAEPAATPTPEPLGTPTPQATGTPTPQATGGTPTPQATGGTPTPQATGTPTEMPQATGTPTPRPTPEPTPEPMATPAPEPTETATPSSEAFDAVTPTPEAADGVAGAAAGLPPGLLFFAGGAFVLGVVTVAWYLGQ